MQRARLCGRRNVASVTRRAPVGRSSGAGAPRSAAHTAAAVACTRGSACSGAGSRHVRTGERRREPGGAALPRLLGEQPASRPGRSRKARAWWPWRAPGRPLRAPRRRAAGRPGAQSARSPRALRGARRPRGPTDPQPAATLPPSSPGSRAAAVPVRPRQAGLDDAQERPVHRPGEAIAFARTASSRRTGGDLCGSRGLARLQQGLRALDEERGHIQRVRLGAKGSQHGRQPRHLTSTHASTVSKRGDDCALVPANT